MKKLILLFCIFAICSCGNDNGASSDYSNILPQNQSSSSKIETNNYIQSEYSSSSNISYWTLEIGNVCNGYNIDVSMENPSKPIEGYMAMYQICGDMATQSYVCESMEKIAYIIVNISNGNEKLGKNLVNLAEQYGAAFGFYNAVDGYLRYAYFELCGDSKGLMKK